jgi:hypothetical protein
MLQSIHNARSCAGLRTTGLAGGQLGGVCASIIRFPADPVQLYCGTASTRDRIRPDEAESPTGNGFNKHKQAPNRTYRNPFERKTVRNPPYVQRNLMLTKGTSRSSPSSSSQATTTSKCFL